MKNVLIVMLWDVDHRMMFGSIVGIRECTKPLYFYERQVYYYLCLGCLKNMIVNGGR